MTLPEAAISDVAARLQAWPGRNMFNHAQARIDMQNALREAGWLNSRLTLAQEADTVSRVPLPAEVVPRRHLHRLAIGGYQEPNLLTQILSHVKRS